MSECILCKGDKKQLEDISERFSILKLDGFMKNVACKIWPDNEAWSLLIDGKEIDYYLTKAQKEMNDGVDFSATEICDIISVLMERNISFAMWYDIFYEDLPVYKNELEVKSSCCEGIRDVSGMCEVYLLYDNE
ncbi:hypothetical protein [Romboutsia ilealis]|uniref:hypothetical protein n=1 Tax=Romboutsia ilealis TaxID=1115758 RepID=UPI00272CF4F8|nr:hypothetical protein [Romboutsia ilealis]